MFFLNCFSVAGSKEIISISSRRLNSRFAVEELKKTVPGTNKPSRELLFYCGSASAGFFCYDSVMPM